MEKFRINTYNAGRVWNWGNGVATLLLREGHSKL